MRKNKYMHSLKRQASALYKQDKKKEAYAMWEKATVERQNQKKRGKKNEQ